jgi:hypothetical protein
MNDMGHAIAFVSGFANEAVAVFWVHHSERGNVLGTGVCSSLQAIALVAGIGEGIRDWHHGLAFIVGYTSGAMAAVCMKGGSR